MSIIYVPTVSHYILNLMAADYWGLFTVNVLQICLKMCCRITISYHKFDIYQKVQTPPPSHWWDILFISCPNSPRPSKVTNAWPWVIAVHSDLRGPNVKREYTHNVRVLHKSSSIWKGLFIDVFHENTTRKITTGNVYRPSRNNKHHNREIHPTNKPNDISTIKGKLVCHF